MKVEREVITMKHELDTKRFPQKRDFPIGIQDDNYYFGITTPVEVEILQTVRGQTSATTTFKEIQIKASIISSDKKLSFVEQSTKNNQVVFDEIPVEVYPRRWQVEDIKRWVETTEKINPQQLINDIREAYEKHIHLIDPEWYLIHALWDLGTYFYPLFDAYPIINIEGISGSGKTKTMSVSRLITFNASQILINPSESTLFREKETFRGTMYIDEAEKLWTWNSKSNTYEEDPKLEVINASYTKNGIVGRQEKLGDKFVTKWYRPYSPMMLASIKGLQGATETRAISRISTKSADKDARSKSEPNENDIDWLIMRCSCYRVALENWKLVKKTYDEFDIEKVSLSRRELQLWKPLLCLYRAFFPEDEVGYLTLINFANEMSIQRIGDLMEENPQGHAILQAMSEIVRAPVYLGHMSVRLIVAKMMELGEPCEDSRYFNRKISKQVDKFGFKTCRKHNRIGSEYEFNKEFFNRIVAPLDEELVVV